jgi:hypothetical protein
MIGGDDDNNYEKEEYVAVDDEDVLNINNDGDAVNIVMMGMMMML